MVPTAIKNLEIAKNAMGGLDKILAAAMLIEWRERHQANQ